MNSLKLLAICGLWILMSLAFTSCGDSETDGDVDGDNIDGDIEDSEITDGDDETGTTDGDDEAELEQEEDGDTETTDGDSEEDGDLEDSEVEGEEETEPQLPDKLNFQYTREEEGTPLTQTEIDDFTKKIMGFLKKIKYFDYALNTTHGVDASTGMRDWQFWYSERFRKEGDTVVFYHPENLTDGGHNLHIPFSRVLGNTLAAHMLLPEDETIALATEQFCKGFSASMLGMVYDENDTVQHLMTRNVVPGFDQEYLTHDGKKKKVDCSGWYSEYPRWNCYRFEYQNNPYWGSVWVTSVRSKDDIPHVFRMVPVLQYAMKTTTNEKVLTACGETLDLLSKFARDIVDNDYVIRSKDVDGNIYKPGYEGDPFMRDYPDAEEQPGDLASFSYWDIEGSELNGQCNAKGGAEFIGYHKRVNNDCGRGEPNWYDAFAINANRYNRRIVRYFHLANMANAIVNNDNDAAALLMDGLEERMAEEKAVKEEDMPYPYQDWMRNLALYYMQSHSMGYPITSDEARLIHEYYLKAVDKTKDWPYWDLWADTVADGATGGYRPADCEGPEETRVCWWRSADLAQIFENCWSPLVNPNSVEFINCDIVKDPSQWDETILDEVEKK